MIYYEICERHYFEVFQRDENGNRIYDGDEILDFNTKEEAMEFIMDQYDIRILTSRQTKTSKSKD